ncbi:MAG: S8 family peptidase [Dehalococcoidia bacterium]|nr:S8 family peptidase [Dehalococcoidia bacterium]
MTIHAMIEFDIRADDAALEDAIRELIRAGRRDGSFSRIPLGDHTIVSGAFDEDRLEDLAGVERVVRIYDDPELTPFAPNFVNTVVDEAHGDIFSIASALMGPLWTHGHRGEGVRIGICDTGIHHKEKKLALEPTRGWTPSAVFSIGEDVSLVPHGTMVAHDALAMAPLSEVLDIGLLKMPHGTLAGVADWRLSVAMDAYRAVIDGFVMDRREETYGLVLCNSWGMRDPEVRWNIGHYSDDPTHPFTRLVVEAIDHGIIVVFAAGNCGSNGGKPYSPRGFSGPGNSIWGANGHPRVITVGAADWNRNWMGYSSEGPSSLAPNMIKPDVCGISQFSGLIDIVGKPDFSYPDAGTSAAAPIVAGGLAVLKGKYPKMTQDVAAAVLRATADHPASVNGAPAADNQYGYGIVNFQKADQLLHQIYP